MHICHTEHIIWTGVLSWGGVGGGGDIFWEPAANDEIRRLEWHDFISLTCFAQTTGNGPNLFSLFVLLMSQNALHQHYVGLCLYIPIPLSLAHVTNQIEDTWQDTAALQAVLFSSFLWEKRQKASLFMCLCLLPWMIYSFSLGTSSPSSLCHTMLSFLLSKKETQELQAALQIQPHFHFIMVQTALCISVRYNSHSSAQLYVTDISLRFGSHLTGSLESNITFL